MSTSRHAGALVSLAFLAGTILGVFFHVTTATDLHRVVDTRPVTAPRFLTSFKGEPITSRSSKAQSSRKQLSPQFSQQSESPEIAVSRASWYSLLLLPLAAAVSYFGAPRHQGTPDFSDAKNLTYVMLSTGAEEAVAEEEPAPTKAPVVVETSYAKIIQNINQKYLKSDVPDIQVGDTVDVGVRIKEGDRERVQNYQGVVICIRGAGLHKAVTVRAVLQGIGVERCFPLHAQQVASFTILKRAKVRRAKLFYLRGRSGKASRLKQRFDNSKAKQRARALTRAQQEAGGTPE